MARWPVSSATGESVRPRVPQAGADEGVAPAVTTAEPGRSRKAAEYRELKRDNMDREMSSGSHRGGGRPPTRRVAVIDANPHDFGIEPRCTVHCSAGVSMAPNCG